MQFIGKLKFQLFQSKGLLLALARYFSWRFKNTFEEVKTFLLFTGYPRSGHSLIGTLIDAHPNAVVSHELNVLPYLQRPQLTRNNLYGLIMARARLFAALDYSWTGYDYSSGSIFQGGKFRQLQLIGDKKGGITTQLLSKDYGLLDQLLQLLGSTTNLKVLHIVRNPFDNIATRVIRENPGKTITVEIVSKWIAAFERDATLNDKVIKDNRVDVCTICLESIKEDPTSWLQKLETFLGLAPDQEWLNLCSKKVDSSARTSRHNVPWNDQMIQQIHSLINRYNWLKEYSFEE